MNSCNKADILKRIQEFREYTGMAKSTLAESIGIEQTTLNNQFLGKRSLSLDVIVALLSSFSELSAEWLLRDMYPPYCVVAWPPSRRADCLHRSSHA